MASTSATVAGLARPPRGESASPVDRRIPTPSSVMPPQTSSCQRVRSTSTTASSVSCGEMEPLASTHPAHGSSRSHPRGSITNSRRQRRVTKLRLEMISVHLGFRWSDFW